MAAEIEVNGGGIDQTISNLETIRGSVGQALLGAGMPLNNLAVLPGTERFGLGNSVRVIMLSTGKAIETRMTAISGLLEKLSDGLVRYKAETTHTETSNTV